MHDPLKEIDADFSLREDPTFADLFESEAIPPEEHWSELFLYDKYDWDDPEFKKLNRGKNAYRAVPVGKRYFMMVPARSYRFMTRFPDGSPKRWTPKIDLYPDGTIMKVYARRSGRQRYDEPATVYAHRELMGCLNNPKVVVDHMNGWGLCNMGDLRGTLNLCVTSHSANMSNSVRTRRKNHDFLPGVEPRGKDRFGGIRAYRVNGKAKYVRSKMKWKTQEPAHRWYLNQLKKLHKNREAWAHRPDSVYKPIFPPLLESERSTVSLKLHKRRQAKEEAIPF